MHTKEQIVTVVHTIVAIVVNQENIFRLPC